MSNIINNLLKNWVFICCLTFFLGMLSLSFLGLENKSLRIVSILLIYLIISLNKIVSINDSILKSFRLYVVFCAISLIFSQNIIQCGFKLLELLVMYLLTVGGVERFKISSNLNLFQVLLYYYILQSIITIIGYYIDPSTIAEDTGYGAYVTFLSCKYPPIHSNGLGAFCGYSALTALTLFLIERKNGKKMFKLFYFFLFALCVYAMYLCSSRTSMISFVIGFMFFLHFAIGKKTKMLIVVIGVFCGIVYANDIRRTVISIMMKKQTEEMISSSEDKTNTFTSGRIAMWEYVLEHPERCILGQGYGTGFVSMWENGETEAGNAHNSMIEILYNSGILALFFWLKIWWLIFKRYRWLMKYKAKLPMDVIWYYLAGAIFLFAFIRSIGNLNFVYFKLDSFALMAIIMLLVYSTQYVKLQSK